jgi:hypothetical protein
MSKLTSYLVLLINLILQLGCNQNEANRLEKLIKETEKQAESSIENNLSVQELLTSGCWVLKEEENPLTGRNPIPDYYFYQRIFDSDKVSEKIISNPDQKDTSRSTYSMLLSNNVIKVTHNDGYEVEERIIEISEDKLITVIDKMNNKRFYKKMKNQYSKRVHLDSITYSNEEFRLNKNKFSGLVYATFQSGKLKSEWEILDGKPHGNIIGYHEFNTDSIFKYSYRYAYSNGAKVGKQYEYYLKEEYIPFFEGYDSSKPADLQWIITDFDENYFGNKDELKKIDFYQTNGCGGTTDKESGKIVWPANDKCPTGELIVYYERLELPSFKSQKLFRKCYGRSKCFHRIHRYKNAWYWE